MTASLEAQARRYLRVFPAWMRADRGEEAVGLVLDLLSPDVRRLPLPSRLDLLRAGLHARRVGTPPLWIWVDVLTAGPRNARGRVPAAWRPWLWQWTSAKGWIGRRVAATLVLAMSLPALLALCGATFHGLPFLPAYVAGLSYFRAEAWRQRVWERNGFVASDPAAPPCRLWYAIRNRPAVPALGWWAGGALAIAAASAVFGLLWEDQAVRLPQVAAPIGLAAVLGWLLVWMGSRSLAGARPEPVRWRVEDSRPNRWALGGCGVIGISASISFGLVVTPLAFGIAAGLGVLRHRARVRGAELGRQIDLWEAVPLVGPGATMPLPPEPPAATFGEG